MDIKELQRKIQETRDQEEDLIPQAEIFQPYHITFNADEVLKMVENGGKQLTIKRLAGDIFQKSYIKLMIEDLLSK